MEGIWILFVLAFLAKAEKVQTKLAVKTNSDSPLQANEKDDMVLNCIIRTAGRPTQFQWWFADTLITNGSEVGNRNDSENYLPSLNEKRPNVFHYNLEIRQVFRTHQGRWTCRASNDFGAIERVNIIVSVSYRPDEMYPICKMADSSLICETQEGNPRVSLEWYVESVEEQLNIKPSSVRTVDGMIYSEVRMSSLRSPDWLKEYVVCETDFGNCSVSKEDVYNQTELYMVKEETDKAVNVHCNVSNVLNEGSLVFEWNDTTLEGKTTLHEGHATLTFKDEGVGYQKEVIVCRYLWGIMDSMAVSIVVNVPLARPWHPTTEGMTVLTGDFVSTEVTTSQSETSDDGFLHLTTKTTEVITVLKRDFPSTEFTTGKSETTSNDGFLHSMTPKMSSTLEGLTSTSKYATNDGEEQTAETMHYFSTNRAITSHEENVKATHFYQTKPYSTEIVTPQMSTDSNGTDSVTDSSAILSTPNLEHTTQYTDTTYLIPTVSMSKKSTHFTEEIFSSSSEARPQDTSTPTETKSGEIHKESTSKTLKTRTTMTVTPTSTKGLELSSRPTVKLTERPTTLAKKPTLPILPPESNVEPTNDQGMNISLLLISLIVIFAVLLVTAIVYQKWKEKTGSYSLPSPTLPNAKNPSASSFRPKPEYSY